MIRLNEIKVNNNLVSAVVVTVETKPQTFEITVDMNEEKLVKNTHNTMDSYVFMAMSKLIQLYQENNGKMPKVAESVWY